MDTDDLLALTRDPPNTALQAIERRTQIHGRSIWIRPSDEPAATETIATIVRDGTPIAHSPWPGAHELLPGDRLLLDVEADPEGRRRFAHWLVTEGPALPEGVSLAPYSRAAAGLHRLWCFAAARLTLPPSVRIEARHDLIGIRLAQIALGFGIDTIGGPLAADRSLPLAGVTRPSEATPTGLATIIRQAGLVPVLDPSLPATPS